MVKHIILWKLKNEYNTEEVKRGIKVNLEKLLGVIDGLVEIKVQTEAIGSSTADVMLYSVFRDAEALKGYFTHPEHVKAAELFVRPFIEVRSSMDFEEY